MEAAERTFRVMASNAQVIVVDGSDALAVEAQRHLDHLEARWSRFLPTSDISRLNAAEGHPVIVCAETLVLVTAMIEAWNRTGRRFDPSLLPALLDAGYGVSIADPARECVLPSSAVMGGDLDAIDIDPVASTVALPLGMSLDPGGLGKGLAADLVVEQLLDRGAVGALVSIGGDLTARGVPPDPSGWFIVVEDPWEPGKDLCGLWVDGGGVATSSTRTRRWTHDGADRHHLIDPRSGLVADTDLAAVTVVAPTGWEAEALATAALLSGDDAIGFLDAHGVEGLAFTDAGEIRSTESIGATQRPTITGGVR